MHMHGMQSLQCDEFKDEQGNMMSVADSVVSGIPYLDIVQDLENTVYNKTFEGKTFVVHQQCSLCRENFHG